MRSHIEEETSSTPEEPQEALRVGVDVANTAVSRLLSTRTGGGPSPDMLSSAGNGQIARFMRVRREPADGGTPAPAPAPPMPATVPPRKNYVFLMGDEIKDGFYAAALQFFRQHEPTAQIVTGKRTLAEIIDTVNTGGVPVLKLYVVSHANEEGNLGFSVDAADLAKDRGAGDHKPRVTFAEVRDANTAGTLPQADVALIDDVTKIEIRGCNIGRSKLMLDQIDTAFGGHGEVVAPTHKQGYSTRGSGAKMTTSEAYLPYFIEQPGDQQTPASIDADFRAKYPAVPASQWPKLLKKVKRKHEKEESFAWTGSQPPADNEKAVLARFDRTQLPAGTAWTLTYKGRSVVGAEYHYLVRAERVNADGSTEWHESEIIAMVPPDDATLIAQAQADHGRPNAYNWAVEEKIAGNQLVRKVFRDRTEWSIDAEIYDATGVAHPAESDNTFFGHSTVTP